ncbi:hypothetical protein [Xanthomonas albilineans]|uniref:hypothetical protein n=1 Tax=Xanthomonas albilineans TaxID=29447 RepID=UPI0012D45756|nr:hypothetical protein [Xanthomonas albilineans]
MAYDVHLSPGCLPHDHVAIAHVQQVSDCADKRPWTPRIEVMPPRAMSDTRDCQNGPLHQAKWPRHIDEADKRQHEQVDIDPTFETDAPRVRSKKPGTRAFNDPAIQRLPLRD